MLNVNLSDLKIGVKSKFLQIFFALLMLTRLEIYLEGLKIGKNLKGDLFFNFLLFFKNPGFRKV